ncbi:hypothetical protein ABB30_02305 [Stenotrophomonas ginsengisoli]|uniref:Fluoride-specific ion channel FluC n=1 Tax=Stenotrophomonas ginsengisoli TaxID=336566 RepID=A0A0R0DB32_9GAMM|nr:fluoride efflux transporter CrcB [Stenotrophomonas ginsengisoli]KRG78886.1 hypothetical protein ABB30_02305 [Stenotrophomonas ginsengisoli]
MASGSGLTLLWVMLGGALGAGLRWWVGAGLLRQLQGGWPWPTLLVNVAGAFAAGYLLVRLHDHPQAGLWRALLVVGFLGGLTTFSSLMVELLVMARDARPAGALLYLASSLGGGLLAVWLGAQLAGSGLR